MLPPNGISEVFSRLRITVVDLDEGADGVRLGCALLSRLVPADEATVAFGWLGKRYHGVIKRRSRDTVGKCLAALRNQFGLTEAKLQVSVATTNVHESQGENTSDPSPRQSSGYPGESSVRLLELYYSDFDLRAQNLSRYSFSLGRQHVVTNIATSAQWLDFARPIVASADGNFTFLENVENHWYSVPPNEVQRLDAELREREIRFENRPIYALRSFSPARSPIASFSIGQYADYKIEMGRLEEETHRVAAEIARIRTCVARTSVPVCRCGRNFYLPAE